MLCHAAPEILQVHYLNSHISFVVFSFFEFEIVSKWCIGEWVKMIDVAIFTGFTVFVAFVLRAKKILKIKTSEERQYPEQVFFFL